MMGNGHEAGVTNKAKKQDRSCDRARSAGTEMIDQLFQSGCQVAQQT